LVNLQTTSVLITKIAELGRIKFEQNDDEKLDIEEKIYYASLKEFLSSFKKNKISPIALLLDSTASGQQVLSLLAPKCDSSVLTALNLNGNEAWHDPYWQTIADFFSFLEENSYNANEIAVLKKYFNRKVLKSSIMTALYNATLFRTRSNILASIGSFDRELDQNIVQKFIPIFYAFLTGDSLKRKFNLKSLGDIKPGFLQNNFDPIYYSRGESSHRIKLMVEGKL
jgi:hypothetical protein